jgi:hypothetical protein
MAKRYCIVKSCDCNEKDSKISLFSFPPGYSKEWIDVVRREEGWLPKKNTTICARDRIIISSLYPAQIFFSSLFLSFLSSTKHDDKMIT